PNLSVEDRAQVAAMLREFLDRVVISPAERMRGIPELRRKLQNFEAIRDLFHLDREKPWSACASAPGVAPWRCGRRGACRRRCLRSPGCNRKSWSSKRPAINS